ncbi:hypothetical protein [Streptacidiphilus rugosus]|uniref:hypothetical protein n=1 Tax=Streptacidiphilus rugosus TaxID=405783 RepID=UPI00055DAFBF|nr:hypothetical protein [Streptacidiphilus rugosus]
MFFAALLALSAPVSLVGCKQGRAVPRPAPTAARSGSTPAAAWSHLTVHGPATAVDRWVGAVLARNADTRCDVPFPYSVTQLDSNDRDEADVLWVSGGHVCVDVVFRVAGGDVVDGKVTDGLRDLTMARPSFVTLQTSASDASDEVLEVIAIPGDTGPLHLANVGSNSYRMHQALIDEAGLPAATLVVFRCVGLVGNPDFPELCTASGSCYPLVPS